MKNNTNKIIFSIVSLSMLTALEVVLSRFLSFSVWNQKIGFAFVAVVVAGMVFGPLGGLAVGGLSDIIGALLFPIGPYFPGFTLTSALIGLCYGFFLNRKKSKKDGIRGDMPKIVLSVLTAQIFGTLLLNTVWISILYGTPFRELLVTRTVECVIMTVIEILVIPFLTKLSDELIKIKNKF